MTWNFTYFEVSLSSHSRNCDLAGFVMVDFLTLFSSSRPSRVIFYSSNSSIPWNSCLSFPWCFCWFQELSSWVVGPVNVVWLSITNIVTALKIAFSKTFSCWFSRKHVIWSCRISVSFRVMLSYTKKKIFLRRKRVYEVKLKYFPSFPVWWPHKNNVFNTPP